MAATARFRYLKRRELAMERDEWQPFADFAPVHAHIETLREAGMPLATIARLAGTDRNYLIKLLSDPPARLRTRFARRLTAVVPQAPIDVVDGGALIDATGTRRRVQALMTLGWTVVQIAAEAGLNAGALGRVLRRNRVHAGTARAVRDAYRAMWDRLPPCETRYERVSVTRTRGRAARLGWAPPLAWDDDIDDPAASPQGVRRADR